MNLVALLLLLAPSFIHAQVPDAHPGCAERGGCGDSAPREPSHRERDRDRDRERDDSESKHSISAAQQAYEEAMEKVREGDYDAALVAVRQALAYNSDFGWARYQYAWLLYNNGRCDLAVEEAQQVTGSAAGQANELIAHCEKTDEYLKGKRILEHGMKIGGIGQLTGNAWFVTRDGRRFPMRKGTMVIRGERVVTGPDAQMVIRFDDDTTLTLGPDTEMGIDDFVYDPSTDAGRFAANLVRGLFRWVTGKMRKDPNSTNMHVAVPTGDLGIRGTDFELYVDDHEERIRLYSGAVRYVGGSSLSGNYSVPADSHWHLIVYNGREIFQ